MTNLKRWYELVFGDWFRIQKTKLINGIWQECTDELTRLPFDWTDNCVSCVII
ncbi:lytic exoenzyme target recognition domain-containing protein [Fructobacillus tropaeoli]|uniref:lytic exoenzyme target recognition domain-containing protein n=1 Tax=Fructobacillus tropaeoli TaxID=709323 RepID=UPI003BA92721